MQPDWEWSIRTVPVRVIHEGWISHSINHHVARLGRREGVVSRWYIVGIYTYIPKGDLRKRQMNILLYITVIGNLRERSAVQLTLRYIGLYCTLLYTTTDCSLVSSRLAVLQFV